MSAGVGLSGALVRVVSQGEDGLAGGVPDQLASSFAAQVAASTGREPATLSSRLTSVIDGLQAPGAMDGAQLRPPVPAGQVNPGQPAEARGERTMQVTRSLPPEFQASVDWLRARNSYASRAGMLTSVVKSLRETGKQLLQS
jgi:hypothetical protein